MVEGKALAVLVSANGYGHLRRQILIVRELMRRHRNLRTVFALTNRQYQRFGPEIEALGDLVSTAIGLTEDSVCWTNNAASYTDQNLNGWEKEWESNASLLKSDFVISDNLVGVLNKRPDALLSGSFLWHEVISVFSSQNKSCRDYVDRDISLLRQNTPTMICNWSIATNAVKNLTNPIGTSWMVGDVAMPTLLEDRQSILVHGGGTRTLDNKVRDIATMLRKRNFEVFTDLEDDHHKFDYLEESWSKVGVVVCRPGAGTATECVKWKIPMIVLRDTENSEAESNAKVLIRLGLAHGIAGQFENWFH